jgi:hypothetical protein
MTRLFVAVFAVALLGLSAAPAAAEPAGGLRAKNRAGTLRLQTVPALAGVVVKVDGATARSDSAGRIAVWVKNFVDLKHRISVPDTAIADDRLVHFDRFRGDPGSGVNGRSVELGVRTSRMVTVQFLTRTGSDVTAGEVSALRLRSNTGQVFEVRGEDVGKPLWVPESRTQQGQSGLASKPLYYVVDSAVVGGSSVVNRAQQKFIPSKSQTWVVELLFYRVGFTSTDLLFGRRVGDGVEIGWPDGSTERLPYGPDGRITVPDVARGSYTVRAYGGGWSSARPLSVSKDQVVAVQIVSWLDLMLVGGAALALALGLLLIGRHRRRRARRRFVGRARVGMLVATVGFAAVVAPVTGAPRSASAATPVPVLAYYYIWFTPNSWNRAKTDYPLVGRYSSDDIEVMRRHVTMAKSAGIDGFLVSWKHTPDLDRRLANLVTVAREQRFRLGIVYQGLDFNREPLPLDTVRTDLGLFADTYAADPVFDVLGKPVVVWTGTDRFSAAEIDGAVRAVRSRISVLGSAKSVDSYEATASALDGDAYYWSSADPAGGSTAARLDAMSAAVHGRGGLWIAPVAPGFDARLVGGEKEVPRRDGDTLRQSYQAAVVSRPDALGVISWNEFSENTHLEPSENHGSHDLTVLAGLLGATAGLNVPEDSSETSGTRRGPPAWLAVVLIAVVAALLPAAVALRRRRRAP